MASIKKITSNKGTGYRIDYYDTDRKRKVKHVYCDRLTAESIANEIEHKKYRVRLGLEQKYNANIPFEDAKKLYLRKVEPQKENSTIVREKKVYKAFSAYISSIPLGKITINDIEGYIKTRTEVDKVTPATMGIELRTLRAFFNFFVKRGYLVSNPLTGIKRPKQEEKSIRFLTTEEISNLFEKIDDPEYKDLILMYLNTGARREEILPEKFTWKNVDFKRKRIKLTGKRNKIRYVPMNETVYQILRRRYFIEKHEFPFDFDYEYLYKKIKQYYKDTGIKNANVHTLRKTFGSLMVQAGTDIFTVSKLLGHSSVRVTENHYADIIEENLISGVRSLEGLM